MKVLYHTVISYGNWFSFFSVNCFGFLYSCCSEFLFLFFLCLLLFPVFIVKLRFSVSAFILSISLKIIDVSNKSSSWEVFLLLFFMIRKHGTMNFIWCFMAASWLHSTTTISCFAHCCSEEWITLPLFFNCSLRKVMPFCNNLLNALNSQLKRYYNKKLSTSF